MHCIIMLVTTVKFCIINSSRFLLHTISIGLVCCRLLYSDSPIRQVFFVIFFLGAQKKRITPQKCNPLNIFLLNYYVLASYLTIATDKILRARQLRQCHRSACMQLLRADADFRTKAKLIAISKACRSIDINSRRINSALE